jgi:hypothetical protein
MSFISENVNLESDTTTEIVSYVEGSDPEKENREQLQGVVAFILEKFNRAKDKRLTDETRWLAAYRNYRGLYGPETQFTDTEKSKAFIKVTKTKVLAAYAQIIDVLFSASKFPIGIDNTPVVTDNTMDAVHFDPAEKDSEGGEGKGPKVPSTIARPDILEAIGGLKDSLSRVPEGKLKEGPGRTSTAYTWEPAKIAAKEMEKLIHDQLEEANASKHLRSFAFELPLFGTGVFKGPHLKTKEYPRWDEQGNYIPEMKTMADVCHVSVWDSYPDPDARNMEEAELFIQRHKMSKTDLRKLKKRPFFRSKSIDYAIDQGPNYNEEYWESVLRDNDNNVDIQRFEVLEYWGYLDTELAEQMDLEIPKEMKLLDQVQVNAWICNDQVIRLVLNPFTPARIPYYSCPYELNPYSFFGIGVAENMMDTQLLMNGFMRLAVDNAALSSNLIFEVDETNLIPGQDMSIYPGKVFRRQSGAPGQAVFSHSIQSVSQEALMLFDKARQLADESTGMPSYSHGMSGIQNTGRTAAGMSMLMGAADKNVKAVVKNIDDYLLMPLGKAMFAFNMQFNFDKKYLGDLEVIALGTESLMRNEVRSQKLLQFMQLTSNPTQLPFVKMDYLLRELAASLDLDPEKVVNDPREAGIQAELIKEVQQKMGIDPNAPPAQAGNPAGLPPAGDPTQTGGGNIGPGAAPTPDQQGFTGGGANAMQGGIQ